MTEITTKTALKNTTELNLLELGPKIGDGSYSKVYVGFNKKTASLCCIKKIEKFNIFKYNKEKDINREIELLIKVRECEAFVQILSYIETSTEIYIETDLFPRGELNYYVRKLCGFDKETTKFYAAEIVQILQYLQDQHIIHRDIKAENLVLTSDCHLILCDFGCAKEVGGDPDLNDPSAVAKCSFVGSSEVIPPELLTCQKCDYNSDLWSFGILVYYMICGNYPFTAKTQFLTFSKIKNLSIEFPPNFDHQCMTLLQKVLVLDPSKRLGSVERGGLEELKKEKFFSSIDWHNLRDTPAPSTIVQVVYPMESCISQFFLSQVRKNQIQTRSVDIASDSEGGAIVPSWLKYVNGRRIIKHGVLEKKKGKGYRYLKRVLIVAEGPNIVYLNPITNEVKGSISWNSDLIISAKSFTKFKIIAPPRIYYFRCEQGDADEWVEVIQKTHNTYYSIQI